MSINKLVYIAHGFCLARYNKPIVNSRYSENVEAWRFGPVVPSIYHEFKHLGNAPIDSSKKSLLTLEDVELGNRVVEPKVEDEDVKKVLNFVIKNYGKFNASELMNITHRTGSPWQKVYESGKFNIVINDSLTKEYYSDLLGYLKERHGISVG